MSHQLVVETVHAEAKVHWKRRSQDARLEDGCGSRDWLLVLFLGHGRCREAREHVHVRQSQPVGIIRLRSCMHSLGSSSEVP